MGYVFSQSAGFDFTKENKPILLPTQTVIRLLTKVC
jgi:hypothetical protein